MSLDDEIARLFSLPLNEFTAARNTFAKELSGEKRAREAERVKKLRKPSLSAWAVNQLAHEEKDLVEDLAKNAERLADATGASEVRDLTRTRHELVARLTDQARILLERSGHAPSADTMLRVSMTLRAATQEEDLDALRRGVLEREVTAGGFDVWSPGGVDLEGGEAPSAKARNKKELEVAERLAREATEAEREAERLRREAERAARAYERAGAAAERAEKEAIAARDRADHALKKL